MFRKLKLQFILTNLAIITALFVSITTGAYILLQINMINHAEFFAKRLVMGINSGIFPEFPIRDDERPHYFINQLPHFNNNEYDAGPPNDDSHRQLRGPGPSFDNHRLPLPPVFHVKTNLTGRIIFQSPGQPFDAVHLTALVQQVFKNSQNIGIINFRHSKYFYYKTLLPKQSGKLIVFQNLKQEKNIQQSLVISLVITGIIFIILAMAGSLFMAKRAIGPIQNAWQQQKNFLADASHELRTPLAVIQTNLEVVLNNPQETIASQIDWLHNIQEEIQQMTVLISSLLFLARVDSKACITDKKLFSFDKVVARVSEAFTPAILAKSIKLTTSITGKIICDGDESNIRQVLEILLDNAIRHTPAGGEISLYLQQTDKKIILSITDTGEGIAAEHLGKIFDRFYQADPSRSKGKAGLGLSIAKCIIENHGGTINVASRPGSGTTFTIQMPLSKDNGLES